MMVQMDVAHCCAALSVVFDGICCLHFTCSKRNEINSQKSEEVHKSSHFYTYLLTYLLTYLFTSSMQQSPS